MEQGNRQIQLRQDHEHSGRGLEKHDCKGDEPAPIDDPLVAVMAIRMQRDNADPDNDERSCEAVAHLDPFIHIAWQRKLIVSAQRPIGADQA